MTKLRKAWLAVAVTAVITTMTGFIPAASAAGGQKNIPHRLNGAGHVQPLLLGNGKERKAGRGKNRRNP